MGRRRAPPAFSPRDQRAERASPGGPADAPGYPRPPERTARRPRCPPPSRYNRLARMVSARRGGLLSPEGGSEGTVTDCGEAPRWETPGVARPGRLAVPDVGQAPPPRPWPPPGLDGRGSTAEVTTCRSWSESLPGAAIAPASTPRSGDASTAGWTPGSGSSGSWVAGG